MIPKRVDVLFIPVAMKADSIFGLVHFKFAVTADHSLGVVIGGCPNFVGAKRFAVFGG